MHGSNSSSVGLGYDPALVIVHITVKVLNTALIMNHKGRVQSFQDSNVMPIESGGLVYKKSQKGVWWKGKFFDRYRGK